MRIEDADPALRELADRIRTVAEWLTNQPVVFNAGAGWYKAGKPIFIWFKLVGPKGSKNRNSVLVAATMRDKRLEELSGQLGNNMFGKGHEVSVSASRPKDLAKCLEFIGRAYLARYET